MTELWDIQLLGTLRVRRTDDSATHFPTQKTASLLTRLAYEPGEVFSRPDLAEDLWPDASDAPLRWKTANLTREIARLRRFLEPPGSAAHGSVVIADPHTVSLRAAAVTSDVTRFRLAARRAARRSRDPVPLLRKAVDLYRGPLVPVLFDEWVREQRADLAEQFLNVVARLVDYLVRAGEQEQAIHSARRAVSLHKESEASCCLLMRTLIGAGRPEEALRQFQDFERLAKQGFAEAPTSAGTVLGEAAKEMLRDRAGQDSVTPPLMSPVTAHSDLPSGMVAFLVTDIEGSTSMANRLGKAFEPVRQKHHARLRQEFEKAGGREFKEVGDGFWVAFHRVDDAIDCAAQCQRALHAENWPSDTGPVRVRMAVHVSSAREQSGDYAGIGLHRAARLVGAAHGGQVLVSEAAAALIRGGEPLSDGSGLLDLGLYKLRDAPAPEHLFLLQYDGMPGDVPVVPRVPRMHIPEIPDSETHFIGREAEIASIRDIMRDPTTRLLTLTGPGGTGKTRLAVEAARAMTDDFLGAIWFVPLTELSEPRQIGTALLACLRQPCDPGVDVITRAAEILSQQPSLLILDNFEQLVPEGIPILQQLLSQTSADLKCLVTSRQCLSFTAEREFEVKPLPVPSVHLADAAAAGPDSLLAIASVRLFVDRAQRSRVDFRITSQNAPAVVDLCERLDGVPLAIELAAAWAKMLSPAQMLTRLKSILVSRSRDVPERHRSLDAAIEVSYRLLDPELRALFQKLSVFRGGWTTGAAESICEDKEAMMALSRLRDSSLVMTSEANNEVRWRMLETVREYASERSTEMGDAARSELHRRHQDYYTALAETGEGHLQTASQEQWLQEMEVEHDNFRAALSSACGSAPARLRLAGALHRFWWMRGHLKEGLETLERALDENPPSEPGYAKALTGAGILAWTAGDAAKAYRYYQDSLKLHRDSGNRRGTAQAANNLAILACNSSDFAAARAYFEESLQMFDELGDSANVATVLSNLGGVALTQRDYPAALDYLQQSLPIIRGTGDKLRLANTLHNLGEVEAHQDNFETALEYFKECLMLRRGLDDRSSVSDTLFSLGWLFAQRDAPGQAARLFGAADAVLHEIGTNMTPESAANREKEFELLRTKMGGAAFQTDWQEGYGVPLSRIISEIIDRQDL